MARTIVMVGLLCLLGIVGCPEPGGRPALIDTSYDAAREWPIDPVTGLRFGGHGPVPELPEWPDNPTTPAKRRLGRALFNDVRLSGSGATVCGVCHASDSFFQSGLPSDIPDRSFPDLMPRLPRNAPSLLNLVYAPVFRWDGSLGTDLYEQLTIPYAEANMNLTPGIPAEHVEVVDVTQAQVELKRKVTAEVPGYVAWYQEAFGQDIRKLSDREVWRLTGMALASFMRRVVSKDSAFDRWNAGDNDAMSEEAIRGFTLFEGEARCGFCHSGPMFTDFLFHNLSLSRPDGNGIRPDEGRYGVTGLEADRGAFLTPGLRDVVRTSPFFHDGSAFFLRDVIRYKTSADARRDPLHDPTLRLTRPLSDDEIEAIVAFLKALSGAPLPSDVTEAVFLDELP